MVRLLCTSQIIHHLGFNQCFVSGFVSCCMEISRVPQNASEHTPESEYIFRTVHSRLTCGNI